MTLGMLPCLSVHRRRSSTSERTRDMSVCESKGSERRQGYVCPVLVRRRRQKEETDKARRKIISKSLTHADERAVHKNIA